MTRGLRWAWVILVAACAGGCGKKSAPPVVHAAPEVVAGPPPLVLMGQSELTCNIDSSKNGVQKLVLRKGAGLAFDAAVSPIVDGTVDLKGPKQGGVYRFTSHLAAPAKGTLSGVGDVDIEELETKVSVEVVSYSQPGGPGTVFSFRASEMKESGAYVEFAGKARAPGGARYAFRINLSEARAGSGWVRPAGPNDRDHIMAKMVMIEAPAVTTIVDSKATIQPIP